MISTSMKAGRGTWVLVGALALILLWTHSMDSKVKQMRARAAAAAAQAHAAGGPQAAVPEAPTVAGPAPAALASVRVAPWGEDPFWKSSPEGSPRRASGRRHVWKPSGAGLQLKGVLWNGTEAGSSVMICNETVRVGETAYRWKVLRITANSVTLEDRGSVITLKLNEDEP